MQGLINTCKKLELHCLSELGWKSTDVFLNDHKLCKTQWDYKYNESNAVGPSSLICVDGKTKILMDCGWNESAISAIYKKSNVESIIANEVGLLVVSHEHMDHLFGVPSMLKLNQKINIMLPHSVSKNAIDYIKGASFPKSGIENKFPHLGELIINKQMEPFQIANGCYSISFPVKKVRDVASEQIIACNVEGKGVILLIGCCHQRLSQSIPFVEKFFNKDIYAIYGGLHLSPLNKLEGHFSEEIEFLKRVPNIYCNHCTGNLAISKMKELGITIKSVHKDANRIMENDKISF
jgi:7,8-dihydropterin-6-yl-methyl-4-(beta-D-ribofuranosyl)aminobenzene 5'-phosphate synthase